MKIGDTEESGKGVNTIVRTYGKDVFNISETDLVISIPYNEKLIGMDIDEGLKNGNEELKAENEGLKTGDEGLEAENEGLKAEKEGVKIENEGLKHKNEGLKSEKGGLKGQKEGLKILNKALKIRNEGLKHKNEGLKIENEVLKSEKEGLKDILTLEATIIELIRDNPNITAELMVNKISKSKSTIERIIRNSKKIKRVGSKKYGCWIIRRK